MATWRAVVFDLDDTLYPEREYVLSGFGAVADWVEREYRVPADATYGELSTLFEQGVRGNTFDRWLSQSPIPRSLVPQLIQIYRDHTPVIRAFPEVPALLANLRGRYRVGLVTDGIGSVQRLKLHGLGLANAFDAVVFSDDLDDRRKAWKPSPRPFLAVTAQLGVAAADAVYVGDNPEKDFLGARQAGLGTIWCRHAGGEYAALVPRSAEYAADDVLDSLSGLARRLDAGSVLHAG